ncbi:MAG: response regulator [Methanomicrobiaceae archaeon]|nr:response regulator [Methanomicrobiaceae archaeon]
MKPRILLIDDDIPTLEVMKYVLPRLGWDPIVVSSGQEALEVLEHERPVVILLDIMMSPMNGWEFLDCMKGKRDLEGIPVILFTAKHIWPEEYHRYADRVECVLEKPVLPAELKKALEKYSRVAEANANA